MKKLHLKNEPRTTPKFSAFPYQREAFKAIKDLEYAAVFHEQGLGKTKIAIDTLLYWIDTTSIDTVLIITKKQLVQNWMKEFDTHTYIKPAVLTNDRNVNHFVFIGPARVIISNFEILQTEKNQFILFLKTRNVAIIIDESTKIKNPDSKLTKVYFELAPLFKKRLIMTGTPVANRPYDIWAQIFFLDYGKSLGKNFSEFKEKLNLSNKLSVDKELRRPFENEMAEIFDKLSSFTVRETKNSGIVELPDKVYIREEAKLTAEQFVLYNRIRKELQVEIVKHGNTVIDDSSAIVKRLLRLVQIVSNPLLVDESYTGESAKESVLKKLIDDIITNGEKCIVWTTFIENVDYFQKQYSQIGAVKIHGRMKIADRNKAVDKFDLEEYKVLFATPTSAKEGLTLTNANHVIFYDRSFSLDDYLQAQDRIHRISQKNTCYIHNIIAHDTVDEWIDILLEAKQAAAALTQGDIPLTTYRNIIDYSFGDVVKAILDTDKEDE